MRGPNKGQLWYCSHCKFTTTQKASPSEPPSVNDGMVFRTMVCSECGNPNKTVEMSLEKLDSFKTMLQELGDVSRKANELAEVLRDTFAEAQKRNLSTKIRGCKEE